MGSTKASSKKPRVKRPTKRPTKKWAELSVDEKDQVLVTKIARLEERRKEIRKDKPFHCYRCDTSYPIKDCTYVQTHWYVPPRGCSEGDYWKQGEGRVVCPEGHLTRLIESKRPVWTGDYINGFPDAPSFDAFKYNFGNREDMYKD